MMGLGTILTALFLVCNGESSIQNISVGGDYNDAPSYIKFN